MNEIKYKEKLLEFLIESNKAKKREVGFVEARTIISEGMTIIGLDANDILGFVKAPNERKIRRVRGSQAWFKKMYSNGWKYAGNFEYEGLINNGFVVMERELPNPVLDVIREELEAIIKEDEGSKYIHVPNPLMDRGEPKIYGPGPDGGYMNRESPDDSHPYPTDMKLISKDMPDRVREIRNSYLEKIAGGRENFVERIGDEEISLIKVSKAREPKEGFESEVNDFMINAKTEMKSDEQLFFEETGKNAVWHGKSTKAFKLWKENLDAV